MSKRKVHIEIGSVGTTEGYYNIWHRSPTNELIREIADENDIRNLLSPERYKQFERGRYSFLVTENKLNKTFGNDH